MRNLRLSTSQSWLVVALIAWLLVAAVSGVIHREAIAGLDFPDTDDAQRFNQVRDWLGGQAWGDIDQYRMNPPAGAVMHWSRLVDLPVALLILLAKPWFGTEVAERIAVAFAPQLALLMSLVMAAWAAARLAGPKAAILAPLFFVAAGQLLPYFAPLRIDHHGWEIALLLGMIAMLADPQRRWVCGVAAGTMAAAALALALEFLPQILVISLVLGCAWILLPAFGRLLQGYGVGLLIGTAFLYPVFVPTARWTAPLCDAMSPVYLSGLIASAALMLVLPRMAMLSSVRRRSLAAVVALGLLAVVELALFPHCAGGPTAGIDPRLLPVFDRISEARSFVSHLRANPQIAIYFGLYPLVGVIASAIMLRRSASETERFGWVLVLMLVLTGAGLMLVQLRATSGATAVAVIAAACVAALWLPRARKIGGLLPRLFATAAILIGLTGALPLFVSIAVARAAGRDVTGAAPVEGLSCTSSVSLEPIAMLPQGIIANVMDMGPYLLVHTPHRVLAGPYHRSASMMLDAIAFWQADQESARGIAKRYGATYVLACSSAPQLQAAAEEAPDGLWTQLKADRVPAWLEPLPVPKGSPLKLYRIKD